MDTEPFQRAMSSLARLANCSAATVSVLAPVRDVGQALAGHLRDCMDAAAQFDVEILVLDNMSIDGCCRHIAREVLIVRTERVEPSRRLWDLGRSVARGESLIWLPRVLGCAPDQFRAIVAAAVELVAQEGTDPAAIRSRLTTFHAARERTLLLTRCARSTADRMNRVPVARHMLAELPARWLRLVVPLEPAQAKNQQPPGQSKEPYMRAGARNRALGQPLSGIEAPLKSLSAIITAYNEGAEVAKTVESIRANTRSDHEIIVVDDGSTDGSCDGLETMGVRVIRHAKRVGVAYSRNAGSRAAVGEVFAYLDGHQRVEPGCLDRCAEIATLYGAIACPPCRPLYRRYPVSYGATFGLDPKLGFFAANHRIARPRQPVERISALKSPAYVIPRTAYDRVAWISSLRGWGATDFSVAVKAFFADVNILHINAGATEHMFRQRIPYETCWDTVWRNHALIARVCFDDRTWARYWLPHVFQAHLGDEILRELNSPEVLAEREAFMTVKMRPDREFWRGLLRIPEPEVLR
jgi:glycosyltransferase involved in cell wall biosynthesis